MRYKTLHGMRTAKHNQPKTCSMLRHHFCSYEPPSRKGSQKCKQSFAAYYKEAEPARTRAQS